MKLFIIRGYLYTYFVTKKGTNDNGKDNQKNKELHNL